MRTYSATIIICLCSISILWIGDAAVDSLLFDRDPLALELFSPGSHDIMMRLLAAAILAVALIAVEKAGEKRRHAETELRKREELYRLVVDNVNDIIYMITIEGRASEGTLELIGGRVEQILGYKPADFMRNTRLWLQLIHPDDRESVLDSTRHILSTHETGTRLYRLRHRTSGDYVWIEDQIMPRVDGNGWVTGLFGVGRDVTKRRQAEEAMRESAEKFRTIFDESKDVFYVSTPDGKFLDINRAGVELFGYDSKEELLTVDIGRDIYVDVRDRKKFVDFVDETSYAKDYEVQMKRKNGEKLLVIITSTALRDQDGKVWGFRGVIRDITKQKKLEQQLLQSQKMEAIGLLAGGIAHDFNNLLMGIMGYGNLLLKELKDDDRLRPHIEQVLQAGDRAKRLTKSILAFSRNQVMKPECVDVNEVIGRVEKFLARLIGEDIRLKAVLHQGQIAVMADTVQLEQVLINLATNARDAMPAGGALLIETSIETLDADQAAACGLRGAGRYAVVFVSDTGTGLDEKTRQRIFEPFFTTKETGKGTGLGLSIAYGIVTQHGGQIMVDSEPGHGAMFRIFLPLAESPPEDRRSATAVNPAAGSETILLAEDDPTVRLLTRTILEGAGYLVVEAATGVDAVAVFSQNPDGIKLALLDVVMPLKSGKEAYEQMRLVKPKLKALFMSGYTADMIHKKGILHEDMNFLTKPASASELLSRVREALDRRQ